MEQKEQYTFEELCNGLEMSMSTFCKMANVDEGTVARIRKGHLARRGTINRLIRTFGEVYGIKIIPENVSGLTLQEHIHQKVEKPPEETHVVQTVNHIAPVKKPIVEPKRDYKPRKSKLPDGCILATEFGLAHNVKRETFRDHMNIGLGPGLIHGPDVPEDGTVLIKDYVKSEERNKRIRKDGTIEKERYLTPNQQRAALQFWRRHDVAFSECDRAECSCHTLKGKQ